MRDYLILAIVLGSLPICLFRPYFGILMWSWIAYFNPHSFGWGIANQFPVAMAVAVPTIIGTLFARQVNRHFFTREAVLLLVFWVWLVFTLFHSTQVPILADHTADGMHQLVRVSKILFMTYLTILLVASKKKLKYLLMVTAFSIGLLGIKGALFGIRTAGEFRVYGAGNSFIGDNNDFALALNMCLPMLFFLARDEEKRWLRYAFYGTFYCSVFAVLLTYSRGGLLGLAVVMAAIAMKSRYKILSAILILVCVLVVFTFAPPAWMARMGGFMGGELDQSAQQRIASWQFAWNLALHYPLTGGGLECFTPGLFERFSPRDPRAALFGHQSSGPHSIYFQVLGEQGFVGLAIFLGLLGSCWYGTRRLRRRVAGNPPVPWIAIYSHSLEVSLLAYAISGAFLGRAYFDLYFQLVACFVVLKILHKREVRQLAAVKEHVPALEQEAEPALL